MSTHLLSNLLLENIFGAVLYCLSTRNLSNVRIIGSCQHDTLMTKISAAAPNSEKITLYAHTLDIAISKGHDMIH